MFPLMKKLALFILVIFTSTFLFGGCGSDGEAAKGFATPTPSPPESTTPSAMPPATPEPDRQPTFVDLNGRLSVQGTMLVNEKGEPVQLKGVSSHDIASYGNLASPELLKYLRDDWGINVFRIAMYTEDAGGYIRNPSVKDTVKKIVDYTKDLGLYVIIDWHILSDFNPMKYVSQSREFFDEMSKLYKDYPNVIYEICNEPNGYDTTWKDVVKPYAEEIIPVIRNNDPDGLIIVGTPTWSQDVDIAAEDPLDFDNVIYALHFYAGTHGESLKSKLERALSKGLPVFVSEWGTSEATARGGVFHAEAISWLKFLDERGISHVNWSLSTKIETTSIVREYINPRGPITDTDLTESGLFVKYYIRGDRNVVLFADGFETKTFTQGVWKRTKTSIIQDNPYRGMYCASFGPDCSLERAITTVPYKNLKLTLAYNFKDAQPGDAFILEWFDGSDWTVAQELALVSAWTVETIALPESASGIRDFKIRLTPKITDEGTRILLDEIWLSADK